MSEADKCKLCGVKKISHYGPGPRQRLGLYCYGSCHELSEQVYEPAEPSPTRPAERVIEVAPQKDSVWTPEKEQEMLEKAAGGVERMNPNDNEANMIAAVLRETLPEVAPQGEMPICGDCEWFGCGGAKGGCGCHCHDPRRMYRRIEELESALTTMREERDQLKSHYADAKELIQRMMKEEEVLREERDRAHAALRGYREHHDTYGSCRIEPTGDRRCKDCRRADSALRPVSDRQPEGETK